MNLFPIFLANAGNQAKRQKDLKQVQLRIAYTFLYFIGLRINKIRKITEKQILDAMSSLQLYAIHNKTKEANFNLLSKNAVKALKKLNAERIIIFQKYSWKYLFSQYKPIHQNSLTRMNYK